MPLPEMEKLPGAQRPLPLTELHPARQYAPAGHGKHALRVDELENVLYVPAGHGVQSGDVAPPVENDPGGQAVAT